MFIEFTDATMLPVTTHPYAGLRIIDFLARQWDPWGGEVSFVHGSNSSVESGQHAEDEERFLRFYLGNQRY